MKVLSLAAAAFMVITGLGASRWILPHQSALIHHLLAAVGQLLGFGLLCLLALRLQRQVLPARPLPSASAPTEERHPLAS